MTAPYLAPVVDDAPSADARGRLESVRARYGFVPNLFRVFANAPAAIDAYVAVADAFGRTSLSATERNLILLAVSRANACHYCVAVHSTVADMQHDDAETTARLRDGRPLDDPRLEALRRLAEAMTRTRGHADAEVAAFLAVGYTPRQLLEVLVGVTLKTLSNYANHLALTPVDAAFAARAWSGEAR
ncbi:MAG: carboxymuconolactone decarboxylase family protein [Myxococcales bacterium]|nr:carboxymuconolactone decarboxylase family protein [Myxococcales bacterium]